MAITIDGSTGWTYSDNIKQKFGTGDDLQIYHDGSNSFIEDEGTGQLRLLSNQFRVKNAADNEDIIVANQDGGVVLCYDNSGKFETSSAGGIISGDLTLNDATPTISLVDTNDSDSTGVIQHTSGNLKLKADSNAAIGSSSIRFEVDGSEKWRIDSNGWLENNLDSGGLKVGAGDDLQIYHDGTDSILKNSTGTLSIRGAIVSGENAAGTENTFYAVENGAFSAYYDHSKKFETTSGGATITGNLGIGGTPGDYDGEADNLVIASSDHTGVTIASTGTDKRTNLYFADGTSGNAQYRGAFTYDHSDDSLLARTAGAERFRIDSSGRILAGTTSVGWDGADDLIVAGSANVGITIRSGDDDLGTLAFADGTSGADGYRGWVQYKQSSEYMTMGTNGTQRLRVDSDGLKFGSDTAAANALDEYEEGSFTPTVADGLNNPTFTHQRGGYVKIGKLVEFQIDIAITGGTQQANQFKLGGLPFTSASSASSFSYGGAYLIWSGSTFDQGSDITMLVVNGGTEILFYAWTGAILAGSASEWNDYTSNFIITGTYLAA